MPQSYLKQIETIINHKDLEGNTALHYAVLNWPTQVVEMLLSLGANASVKNKNNQIPLKQIRRETFKNFLDKKCIIVEGFDQGDDEIKGKRCKIY